MDKFWLVWNPRRTSPTCQHESEFKAREEAERLARLTPGDEFVVLESLAFCKVDLIPVNWRDTDDIPF